MSVAEPSKKGGHHGLETVRENPDADVEYVFSFAAPFNKLMWG